jgi:hypothetical protein
MKSKEAIPDLPVPQTDFRRDARSHRGTLPQDITLRRDASLVPRRMVNAGACADAQSGSTMRRALYIVKAQYSHQHLDRPWKTPAKRITERRTERAVSRPD